MFAAPGRPLLRGRILAFAGILLVAVNLRTSVGALSPIAEAIGEDLPLDTAALGVIGAAPPVCFALFGLVAPVLARRIGIERLLILAIVSIVAGQSLRALAPSLAFVIVGSIVTFAGIGAGNVLLPPLVKKYFPDRVGLITTMYVTVISVSTLVPPLVAVPAADAWGWRASLGMWVAIGIVALAPWAWLLASGRTRMPSVIGELGTPVLSRIWRSKLAWALAIVMSASSVNIYSMLAWMPVMLADIAGIEPAIGGVMLAVYAGMGVPAGLVVPVLATRLRSIAPLLYLSGVCWVVGYLGFVLFPSAGLTLLWSIVGGTGGLLFPLTLVMINLRTRTHQASAALSGFVQGIGYIIAASGTLLFGLLHEVSGGWSVPLVFLIGTAVVGVLAGLVVAKPRMLEDGA